MKARWKADNTTVYDLNYHLIWCPKYRRKILTGNIEIKFKGLLKEKAVELGLEIKQMEVMPDHVHLFVKFSPIHSPYYIVQQFKIYTPRIVKKEFKKIKSRLPLFFKQGFRKIARLHLDKVHRSIANERKGFYSETTNSFGG